MKKRTEDASLDTNSALNKYKDRKRLFSSQLKILEKQISLISNLRLIIVFFTLVLVIILYKYDYRTLSSIALSLGAIVFIVVIKFHDILFTKKNRLSTLVLINSNGIKRITDNWHTFTDNGEEFINDDHSYSSDIDIFGQSSLFQWINSTHTYFGKQFLSSVLIGTNIIPNQIKDRQSSIKELALLLDFRQNVEEAGYNYRCVENPISIIEWAEQKSQNCINKKLGLVYIVLPYLSLLVLLSDLLIFKTVIIPTLIYIFQLIIFRFYNVKISKLFNIFENRSKILNPFSKIIRHIEKCSFSSHMLMNLQSVLTNSSGQLASKSITEFSTIVEKTEIRYNALPHFIVNTFWLWDIKNAIKAEKWKNKHGKNIRNWLETVGHFESLSSLSIIPFENQSWIFPNIDISEPTISVEDIKHPLIPKKSNIGNNFNLSKEKKTAIITGSNMSGKSTFLRTIAINLALAYAGAPVNAKKMTCGIFTIYTSMRTKDNLKGNISTFYSELLRIKSILDTAKTGKNTLFLIDEIFNGTNSQDRITGAIAVLNSLQLDNTIGIISTHDLELCNLAKTSNSKFINYHFKENYKNNTIQFDYKIYPGPSETRNALFLIKMVGIPINNCMNT